MFIALELPVSLNALPLAVRIFFWCKKALGSAVIFVILIKARGRRFAAFRIIYFSPALRLEFCCPGRIIIVKLK